MFSRIVDEQKYLDSGYRHNTRSPRCCHIFFFHVHFFSVTAAYTAYLKQRKGLPKRKRKRLFDWSFSIFFFTEYDKNHVIRMDTVDTDVETPAGPFRFRTRFKRVTVVRTASTVNSQQVLLYSISSTGRHFGFRFDRSIRPPPFSPVRSVYPRSVPRSPVHIVGLRRGSGCRFLKLWQTL